MKKEKFLELVERIRNGKASDEDISLYNTWFTTFQQSDIRDTLEQGGTENFKLLVYDRISQQIHPKQRKTKTVRLLPRFAVAASVLIVTTGLFYLLFHKPIHPQQTTQNQLRDIGPGSDKAILTLSNGKQISLTEANNGQIAVQGNIKIHKIAHGKIIYQNMDEQGNTANAEVGYNIMATPKGGQHWVSFADGSRALLNAGSRLRYPTTFNGNERVVELTGEAYFEVVHNATKPFKVISKGQVVEVLGTHFNINSYANEASVKTTLLEGSVRVIIGHREKVLKPGQQLTLTGKKTTVTETDVEEAVAWKDGYLEFTDQDIQSVMREISRWYDVDVEFEGPVTAVKYSARISKFTNLSQILKILQSTKTVQFIIKGRRIMVKQ